MEQPNRLETQSQSAAAIDDEFELVRQSFVRRLQGELIRLKTLERELAATDKNPITVLNDIETFAHRLRGAAAVFDAFKLSKAARALELAATAATHGKGRGDSEVWSTLQALATELTAANGEESA